MRHAVLVGFDDRAEARGRKRISHGQPHPGPRSVGLVVADLHRFALGDVAVGAPSGPALGNGQAAPGMPVGNAFARILAEVRVAGA